MTYNAGTGMNWQQQLTIAKNFGFNSARFFTMIDPDDPSKPLAACQVAANLGVSVLLGAWTQNDMNKELDMLKQIMQISNIKIIGLSIGNEDLYKATISQPHMDANSIANWIGTAKSTVGGRFPVGHVDTWGQWITGDGVTIAKVADFIGHNA